MNRRLYIDWLRGVAVLIMIEAHVLDAWTSAADRGRGGYRWAIVLGGLGAPLFLFLAGVTLTLAAGARERKGLDLSAVAALARRRGWQVFGLAFLFRLQSWLISRGTPVALLKVDILNVMGLSMVVAAALWGLGRTNRARMSLLGGGALLAAMAAPVVIASPALAGLPAPLGWYFAPVPKFSSFTMLPWIGFLLAGAAVGTYLVGEERADVDGRPAIRLVGLGGSIAAAGFGASFLPPLYESTTFWGSSPTFFFARLGVVMALLGLARAWTSRRSGPSVLAELGASSLFVYWIHVELAYGVVSSLLHRRLSFGQVVFAYVAFSVAMFLLVRLKNRLSSPRRDQPDRISALAGR